MPSTTKRKVNKQDIVDIIRDVFVTKEDAEYVYEKIHEKVLDSLLNGYDVNLFGCVAIEAVHKNERIIPGAFGGDDIHLPKRRILKTRVYPTLSSEWDFMNGAS